MALANSRHAWCARREQALNELDRLKELGVESVCYVAITGPQDVFDLPVPLEYSNSEFLKEKYRLALNSL